MSKLLPLGILLAWCASAAAQPATEPATGPTRTPGFAIMDRQDAASVLGLEASYLFLNNDTTNDVTLLRFDVSGRYVTPAGIGVYAQMPFTYASGQNDSTTGVGDAEVGGLIARSISPTMGIVAHAGLTLPTGSDSLDGAFANLFGAVARPVDIYQALPQATTLRIGVSPLVRQGTLYARFDLGLDVNLDVQDTSDTADTIFHVDGAVGVDAGSVLVAAELSSVKLPKGWINVGALSARLPGQASPYLALVVPIDDDSREVLSAAITAGVTIGI